MEFEEKHAFNVFYFSPTFYVCAKKLSVNVAMDNSVMHLEIVCDSMI